MQSRNCYRSINHNGRAITSKTTRHSLIVGGGFVGLSTALHLQRSGRRVTVIESSPRIGGAASCSYGNAGTMAVYANVPVNSPSIIRKLPDLLLLDSTSPLSITPSWHLPKMIPWAALFLWNCRAPAVEHTAASLGALLSRAESGWENVWKQSGIDIVNGTMGKHASSVDLKDSPWRVKEGYLILQRTKADMLASQAGADLRRRFVKNLTMKQLKSADEVLELEPNLDPQRCDGGAWYFPDAWCLRDPGALLRGLASGLEAGGGVVRNGSVVVDIQSSTPDESGSGAVRAILDDGTHISADEIVIAAGAHSAHLLSSSMGEFCPLETERGYSIQYTSEQGSTSSENSKSLLTRAVCDASAGWIATPMASGLRVAGKVELGGVQAPPTPARFDQIERETSGLLGKDVGKRMKSKDWLGFRPTMPDALPVIGRSRKLPNSVFYAFGHQHVGWTLGGITGKLIAELVQGEEPSIDLSPYSLDRFRFTNWVERWLRRLRSNS